MHSVTVLGVRKGCQGANSQAGPQAGVGTPQPAAAVNVRAGMYHHCGNLSEPICKLNEEKVVSGWRYMGRSEPYCVHAAGA
jgi:hypothetical protein